MQNDLALTIRPLRRTDVEPAANLERKSTNNPWCAKTINTFCEQPNTGGLAIYNAVDLVAYVLYTVSHRGIEIRRACFLPGAVNHCIMISLLSSLESKLNRSRRYIQMHVWERDTRLIDQLRAAGFQAVAIAKHNPDFPDDDSYVMQYSPSLSKDSGKSK
jgi:ribosomal protein S18 acetylase RimI-like enzyme